ncbi:vWA domain-containing protein [Acetanaerobacterium elongatum]|uniref:von Willebrand factor type A domain-containing protein n=1 Tax=Acetanaerobacterium elongatum TaxID=258515 RepID=A0A1G9V217_9FIRM|nr:VWA domain-containing protein [Acetanaerobacterium elongatum]SDM66168.1 von Willebrand factor type A domain-containing protein [Acetanaerobacterium elongatum]
MVKNFKTSGAKRLFSLLVVVGLLVSLAFNSSLSLAAKEEKDEHTHELIVHAEEILAALENGNVSVGESSNGTTLPGDSVSPSPVIVPPGQSSPPGGSVIASVEQNQFLFASAMSTAGSSEAPAAPGSSVTPGSSAVPGSSTAPGSSTIPGSSSVPGGTPEVTKKTSLIDQIDIPFGSKTMKADLEEHLKNNLPVRFFDHSDIGCNSCQALVTVNPSTKKLSIIAINSSETETHTFKLSIVNKDNSPLKLKDVSQEVTSAEKKTFDGEIKESDIPAGAEVEIIEVITGSESSTASSSQPASSSEAISSSSESSESGSSIGTEPSVNEALAASRSFAYAATANTSHESAASEESSSTSSAGDNSVSSSSDASSEASSSATSSSEQSSTTSSAASSEVSSAASSSDTSSSSSSSGTGESRPADEVLKTVALVIQTETANLGVQAYAGTDLKVPSGITMLKASQAPLPSPNDVVVDKQATYIPSSDRMYQVSMNAYAPKGNAPTVDIVLVLDASGSMPWLITQPTEEIGLNKLQPYTNPPTQYDFSYYKYFVLSSSSYIPIEYLSTVPNGYSGNVQDNGWYRIESNSNGTKQIKAKITGSDRIFIKGPTDKTKLEMLQDSAKNFVTSVAAVSPNSKIGVVSFNHDAATLIGMTQMTSSGAASVNSAISNIHLTGDTRHDRGLKFAQTLLEPLKNDGLNKYVILFTDGEPRASKDENGNPITQDQIESNAISIARSLKLDTKLKIFSIGLYDNGISDHWKDFIAGLASSTGLPYYYDASNSDLNDVFNTIFSGIAQGFTGAVVTDVINERFKLTSGSRAALEAEGAVITTDSLNRDVITWNNQTIPCTGNAATGWKKTFTIQAKENYVGGNQVPTNDDGSQLSFSNTTIKKVFRRPVVDVPLRYDLDAKDGYFYIGDEVGASARLAGLYQQKHQWETYGDTTITYSAVNDSGTPLTGRLTADTPYKLRAMVTPNTPGTYPATSFTSDSKKLYMLSPAITLSDFSIFAGESTNLNERAAAPVWQYKSGPNSYTQKNPAWVYAGSGISDAPPTLVYSFKNRATNAQVNTPVTLFEKTNFDILAWRTDIEKNSNFNFNLFVRYTNSSKNPPAQGCNGWFTIDVQFGSITVNKQISDNWEPHGDPIFVYKLDRLNATGGVEQSYNDYIRFTGGSTGERSIIFDKLPKGTYRLTELDTLRYQLQSIYAPNGTNISIPGKSVDFSVSKTNKTPYATFVNIKVENKWFSDTDVVKNTFKVGSWTTTPR